MRKHYIYVILFFIGFVLILFGCNNVKPELIIAEGKLELQIGDTKNILYEVKNNNNKETSIIFVSQNNNIATVNPHGLVSAIAEGETTILVNMEEDPDNVLEVTVTVSGHSVTITGVDTINVGESVYLQANDNNHSENIVGWESLNPEIATVSQDGKITGISEGVATIKVFSLISADYQEKDITVVLPVAESLELSVKGTPEVLSEVTIKYVIQPAIANPVIVWKSSNSDIATVDANGLVFCQRSGIVEIIAKTDNGIEGRITLNITVDPIKILKAFNIENPIVQNVTIYGNTTSTQMVYGSVSYYYPGSLNLKIKIIDITDTIDGAPNPYIGQVATEAMLDAAEFKTVRSGILKPAISNIIYHDTGNINVGANAAMHASYMIGPDNFNTYRARSWHYTVDEKEVIQHLPDNEVAWQGDTYEAYSTTIGVETCVDAGSDLYMTWHRTAKLMAMLLIKHNLRVTDVKQHYDFSRKECPQTLRRNGLYNNAISLIEAEYIVSLELSEYTITFTSNAPEYVDDYGRIIKLDATPKRIGYLVNITNESGYNKSAILYSTLPANNA